MVQVIPAIIPQSFDDLKNQIGRVKKYVSLVQVDVMDGSLTGSKSWPYDKKLDGHFKELIAQQEGFPYWTDVNFEIDLMVKSPERCISDWVAIGASTIILHVDSTAHLDAIIKELRIAEVGIGLAYRPQTPNKEIEKWIPLIDFVQCMGNDKIGYHGVALNESILVKIKDLRNHYPGLILGVDIGVTMETAPKLVEAGANRLVSGSAIFESKDIESTIKQLSQSRR